MAETTVFSDDFESYAPATFPAAGGWTLYFSGAGPGEQFVDAARAFSGGQSLRTMGSSCWASAVNRRMAIPSVGRFETAVYLDQIIPGGCTGSLVHAGVCDLDHEPCVGRFFLRDDGWIAFSAGSSSIARLAPYEAGRWYRLAFEYDLVARTANVFVDGVELAHGVAIPATATPVEIFVGAVHGSNPVAWFDDVRLVEITRPCVAPPAGLVAWWPGDESARDVVGNHHGTLVGGARSAPGIVDSGFLLDGVDDHVGVASSSGVPLGSSPRTLMAWFKTPASWSGPTFHALVQYGRDVPGGKFGLYFPSYWNYSLSFWGHNSDVPGGTILEPDRWYHAAVTYDGATVTLFLDGQLESSAAMFLNTGWNANGLTIGYADIIGARWGGLVDEVQLFDRALSAGEISAVYHAGSAGTCRPCATPAAGLVSRWSFEEPGGSIAFDAMGAHDASLVGATRVTGFQGQAASFAGGGEHVALNDDGLEFSAQPFSVEFWFYSPAPGVNTYLVGKTWDKNGWGEGWALYYYDARIRVIGWPGWGVFDTPEVAGAGLWHHVALSVTDATVGIFVDGVLQASRPNAGFLPSVNRFRIGDHAPGAGWVNPFQGLIDEVSVYDRALTADEIVALYDAGRSGACGLPGDQDSDGVPDATDNCPQTANAGQADSDADGVGDACDPYPESPLWVEVDVSASQALTGGEVTASFRLLDPRDSRTVSELSGIRATLTLDGAATFGASASIGRLLGGGGTGRVLVEFVEGYVTLTIRDATAETVRPGGEDTERQGIAFPFSRDIFLDFESDDGGFTHQITHGSHADPWEWGVPTSGPGAAFSGSKVWATTLGGDYPDRTDAILRSPSFDVPWNRPIIVEFASWFVSEPGYDWAQILVRRESDGYGLYLAPNLTGSLGGYSTLQFQLGSSSLPGKRVHIEFRMVSDYTGVAPGWYIDDFAVRGQETTIQFLDPAADEDGDGLSNADEFAAGTSPLDPDSDDDSVQDGADNCPAYWNPSQADADADGRGDPCDACPLDPANDADGDGICGNVDNCPSAANPNQSDRDGDGLGDLCDPCPDDPSNDVDGDGVCGSADNCPAVANANQSNRDADSLGDACDPCPDDRLNDVDGDGVCGNVDNCPTVANPSQTDSDHDGLGDPCDLTGPDLTVEWRSMAVYNAGKRACGTFRVRNTGDRVAKPFYVTNTLVGGGTTKLVSTFYIRGLAAGYGQELTSCYTSTTSLIGKAFLVFADAQNAVLETNEGNNKATRSIP